MRNFRPATLPFLFSALLASSAFAADKTPELVTLVMPLSGGADIVGEVISQNATSITVFDLKSAKQRTLELSGIKTVKHNISDADAIAGTDLASVLAWKVNKLSATTPTLARVAKISDSTIYLTIGGRDGLTVGEKLNVFRVTGDINDPVTHKLIAHERPRIAELTVTEVQDAFAKAKLVGDLEVKLAAGDEVETIPLKVSVAVVPLTDADGNETEGGVAVSEDLTTALVSHNVQVIERNSLKSVIKEMAIQSSDLFDPNTVQRLGKQIGASTVLTGKIVPDGNQTKIHIRLINVETGQVLLAASETVAAKGALASGGSGSGGTSAAKAAAGTAVFGSHNPMPDFLTTKDAVSFVKDGVDLKGNKYMHTKDRNLFKGDFTMDIVCTKSPGDGILFFGAGELSDSGGEPPNAIKIRFHAPDLADGKLDFDAPGHAEETIGHIRTGGTHLLRVEKKGGALTLSVWANYDGKLADNPDVSNTIPDINDFDSNLVKSGCIFFGNGVVSKVTLTRNP